MSTEKLSIQLGGKETSIIMNGGGCIKTFDHAQKFLDPNVPNTIIMWGGITKNESQGNAGNVYSKAKERADVSNGDLNKLGLPNMGIEKARQPLKAFTTAAHANGKLVGVNVSGFTPEEFVQITFVLVEIGIDYIELNGGCPNALNADGTRKSILCYNPDLTHKTLSLVEPVIKQANSIGNFPIVTFKASYIPQENQLIDLVNVVNHHHYLHGVVLINTLAGASAYNEAGELVIGLDGYGGLSGPAIKPLALGTIRQWKKLLNPAKKILGLGGIESGRDIHDFILAGADMVQITSHYLRNNEDVGVYPQLLAEYTDYL